MQRVAYFRQPGHAEIIQMKAWCGKLHLQLWDISALVEASAMISTNFCDLKQLLAVGTLEMYLNVFWFPLIKGGSLNFLVLFFMNGKYFKLPKWY